MAEAGAGNLAQAIGHFQRSIRLGNNSASIHYNLGIACLQAGRREEGIRELRTALARDGKFLPARYPLGIALLGEGRAREALPYLTEETKTAHRRGARVALRWARVSWQVGEPKEALAVLENVPAVAGAPGEVMLLRGEARALAGDFALAEVDLAAARDADPQNRRYLI